MRVKYSHRQRPTKFERIGALLMLLGLIPLLIEFFFVWLGNGLPMDLSILYVSQIIPNIDPLLLYGVILIVVGKLLTLIKWKTGELNFMENGLNISADNPISIPFKNKIDIVTNTKHNKIKIKSHLHDITFDFNNKQEANNFKQMLENVI